MGVIKDGKYYPNEHPEKIIRNNTLDGIHENNHFAREYEKHAHNLIQPNNPDGTVNQDFIDFFPEDAKNHGFIKEESEE